MAENVYELLDKNLTEWQEQADILWKISNKKFTKKIKKKKKSFFSF
jgi:hypothetical protein